ncbi:MAG: serine/threonine protein kinase [Planctomycetes bacterium]|nr:serine/threonine protein kinase [Planctomycetota bacterium]
MQTINGFQILRKVAESNTAEIFHVMRLIGRGRGNDYAAKTLREEYARDRVERHHLETEYRICSVLNHPNLIHAHELQLSGKRPFLVLDMVQGPSLRQHLEHGRPPLEAAMGWIARAADGLAYFHEIGFVHRDVKPQNIVVGAGADVRVIDFALAMRQDASFGNYLMRRMFQRRRPGTWSYMSPEQIRHQRLSGLADMYSLGVTVFEVATGRPPYTADTPQGLMEQHLYASIPSLRSLVPEAPHELDELARAMMAKDPLDRPTGMQYVSGKLRSIAASLSKA